MPPVRLGLRPYGMRDNLMLSEDDPWGWPISEYEEGLTLRPGLRIWPTTSWKARPLCRRDVDSLHFQEQAGTESVLAQRVTTRAKALDHERFVLRAAAGPVHHSG